VQKFNVFVRSTDGRHKINKRAVKLSTAKQVANKWLGPIATWMGSHRAISMYGDVLTIEEKEN